MHLAIWTSMEFYGILEDSEEFYGYPWNFYRFQWHSMEVMNSMDIMGIQIPVSGSRSVNSMEFPFPISSMHSMNFHGFHTCMNGNGNQWTSICLHTWAPIMDSHHQRNPFTSASLPPFRWRKIKMAARWGNDTPAGSSSSVNLKYKISVPTTTCGGFSISSKFSYFRRTSAI